MYKCLSFIVCVMVVVVNCRPQSSVFPSRVIPLLSKTHNVDPFGQYQVSYHSGDGTHYKEEGRLKLTPDGRDYVLVKSGSYSYLSPDHRTIEVSYIADENGFQPRSPIIPVAPTVQH